MSVFVCTHIGSMDAPGVRLSKGPGELTRERQWFIVLQ